MTRTLTTFLVFSFVLMGCQPSGGEPATSPNAEQAPAPGLSASPGDGSHFGGEFTLTEVTPVDLVIADPASFVDKTVRVEGTVVDVCEMRGCWLSLGAKSGEVLRVKVRDGEMVFPISARGLQAQVEGTVGSHTISVEDQIERGKYFAAEEGQTFDPASVTGPKTIYLLSPTKVFIAS